MAWPTASDSKPSNASVRGIVAKFFASIDDFAAANYDLGDYGAGDSVETSIDWFDLMQKNVYPADPGVRYFFVAEKKIPSIILPLRLSTSGRIRTVESLSNYYTSLYTPLLGKGSIRPALREMLAAAANENGGAHVMRFTPMDPDSPAYAGLLEELREIGWIPYRFFSFGNWFLKVGDDWQTYLKTRSANLRSSIKRRNKEFAAEGGTLEIATDAAGIEPAIAAYQEVYSASWKKPEPHPDFIAALIRRLAEIRMLRLGIARLHGKPIAAQLWIVGQPKDGSQGKASIYKVAYHEKFASFSPGIVLTSHLLQHVIDTDRVKEVDFLIGDDDYKQFWMSDRRERWGIVAYNPRTIIGLSLLTKEVAGRAAKSLSAAIRNASLRFRRRPIGAAPANGLGTVRLVPSRLNPTKREAR
jgi:hypothetical protein